VAERQSCPLTPGVGNKACGGDCERRVASAVYDQIEDVVQGEMGTIVVPGSLSKNILRGASGTVPKRRRDGSRAIVMAADTFHAHELAILIEIYARLT